MDKYSCGGHKNSGGKLLRTASVILLEMWPIVNLIGLITHGLAVLAMTITVVASMIDTKMKLTPDTKSGYSMQSMRKCI